MLALLTPRFWLGLALVAALAWSHSIAYKSGSAGVRSAWDAEKLATSEASRIREKALTITTAKVDHAYQADKKRRADADRRTADSLRDYQAAASASTDTTTASGTDDPYRAIASQCTEAIVRLDEYAQGLASKATALQGYTREVCMMQ